MTPLEWTLLGLVGASSLAGVIRPRLARRRLRRALRGIPPLTADTPDGSVVRVAGRVRAIDTVIAPLSARTCVMYATAVQLRPAALIGVDRLQHVRTELAAFVLEREGAPDVLVEGPHARLAIKPVRMRWVDGPAAESFLRGCGVAVHRSEGAVYEEMVLEAGARVEVAGLLVQALEEGPPTDERTFREGPRVALRLAGDARHPVTIVEAA